MLAFRSVVFVLTAGCGLLVHPGWSQRFAAGDGGRFRLFPADLAVFEAGEPRTDLPCQATSVKPILGFDLRFHSGYDVLVPLKELAGEDNLLTILFRVSPTDREGDPLYFTQKVRVPALEEESKGEAFLQGGFDIGEGKYKVEWLMRDKHERVCSNSWEIDASLPQKDREMELTLPPATVQASDVEQFKEDPPVTREQSSSLLHVKMMVNFAPQSLRASSLRPVDTHALVSILRTIARDPRVGKFTLVAFNLQEQRIVFRQSAVDRIDFPALGEAINSIDPGTVDIARLAKKNGETEFLTKLVREETTGPEQDALIFAGPKAMLEENVSTDALREVGDLPFPVFYMNYNLSPQAMPWRDAIGNCVKHFKGQEFTITRPRDLWFSVSDMVGRIAKLKHGRTASVSSY